MSELDVVLSKINVIKNCLMAIEKASTKEKDPDFLLPIYEIKPAIVHSIVKNNLKDFENFYSIILTRAKSW